MRPILLRDLFPVHAQVGLGAFLIAFLTDPASPHSYLTNNGGGEDPNGTVGNKGADQLIVNITDTRNLLKSLGLSVPVGNSDAGSYFNTKVLQAVDYGVCLGSWPLFRVS